MKKYLHLFKLKDIIYTQIESKYINGGLYHATTNKYEFRVVKNVNKNNQEERNYEI